jgi:hypothetical protein
VTGGDTYHYTTEEKRDNKDNKEKNKRGVWYTPKNKQLKINLNISLS